MGEGKKMAKLKVELGQEIMLRDMKEHQMRVQIGKIHAEMRMWRARFIIAATLCIAILGVSALAVLSIVGVV